ncbi:MAG: hypothetical protein ACK50D_08410 [Burkholderiales bacterium]|jgi:hypothetical protein
MTAKKLASHRCLKSALARVVTHRIRAAEYGELPELNEGVLKRAVVKIPGRPSPASQRQVIV